MDFLNTMLNWAAPPFTFVSMCMLLPPLYFYKLFLSFLSSLSPEDVAGKVVLITGASSGIGEFIAYEYARRGACLALAARRERGLREVADRCLEIGSPDAFVIAADVAKDDDCKRMVDSTVTRFGRLDHLVNNAGISSVCTVEEVDDITNLRPIMEELVIDPCVYLIYDRILTSGAPSTQPDSPSRTFATVEGESSSCRLSTLGFLCLDKASKAALQSMFETIRIEVWPDVKVTIVTPGPIESEFTRGKMLSKDGDVKVDQDMRDVQIGMQPVETAVACAREIVKGACRGDRCVIVPAWYRVTHWLMMFCPEVVEWCYWLLYMTKPHGSPTEAWTKKLLDVTGARAILYPSSLGSTDIKTHMGSMIKVMMNIIAPPTTILFLTLFFPPYYLFKSLCSTVVFIFLRRHDNLHNKVVLVTRASSGIGGIHVAYEYARRGGRLALVARRPKRLQAVAETAQRLGSPDEIVIPTDEANLQDTLRFIANTMSHFGRLDYLVINAGIGPVLMFEDVAGGKNLAPAMETNSWGAVYTAHTALPHLRNSTGRIVAVCSSAAWLSSPRLGMYSASKATMLSFFEALRIELKGVAEITIVTPRLSESELTKGKFLSKEGKMVLDQDLRDIVVWKAFFPELLDWLNRLLVLTSPGKPANEAEKYWISQGQRKYYTLLPSNHQILRMSNFNRKRISTVCYTK
ncbi:hypothetical protein V2J09_011899 [Rumex salicifolius]